MKKWVSETFLCEYCGLIILGLARDLRYILSFRSAFPALPPVAGEISEFGKLMVRGNYRKLNGKLSKVAFVFANY